MNKRILFATGLILSVMLMSGMVMAATSGTAEATVTVPGYLSITLSDSSLDFGNMNPGDDNKAADPNPLIIAVGPETNVDVEVGTRTEASVFTDGSHTMGVENMRWATTDLVTGGIQYTSTEVPGNVGTIVRYDVSAQPLPTSSLTMSIFHRLSIPDAQPASLTGGYAVNVIITGTPA